MKARIATASWTYTAYGSPASDQLFRRLADIGYEGVELSGSPNQHPPSRYTTVSERRALRDHFKNFGLEPCGLNARLNQNSPLSRSAEIRSRYVAECVQVAQFCADVGISTIRVDTELPPPVPPSEKRDLRDLLIDTWYRCARAIEPHGVTLVWEYEPQFAFNLPNDILGIVRAVDHPNFTALFDTSHTYCSVVKGARADGAHEPFPSGMTGFIAALGGRIGRVHLADSDGSLHDESTSTHMPLGTGKVDFKAVLEALLKAGYASPWFTADPCFWPDPMKTAKGDFEFTQRLLKKAGMR
jgi:sugar phosphate isomerase/epimerase